jgi:hypothetical protein
VCGNGVCEQGEDFSTCLADCSGVAQAKPMLPIAIGECQVAEFLEAGCPAGPLIVQIPDVSGSSCFSSLSATPASVATVVSYLPATCCSGTTCGQGAAPPVAVGDVVSPVNGQFDVLLRVLADCVTDGTTEFVAPVVPCGGSCNQGTTVVGFVGVHLTQVVTSGATKGVSLVPVCSCGDGTCSAGESCQSCRADCGACPPVCQ